MLKDETSKAVSTQKEKYQYCKDNVNSTEKSNA